MSPLVTPFVSYHQEGIVNDSTKFRVNLTYRCGDIEYSNLVIGLRGSWGSSELSFMSSGHISVEICNTSCLERNLQEVVV